MKKEKEYVAEKTDWGWPEEFDAYEMGTPETTIITSADIEQRVVYCRKSLKKMDIKKRFPLYVGKNPNEKRANC